MFAFPLVCKNLFTITGYKGADPAGFSFGNHDYENGEEILHTKGKANIGKTSFVALSGYKPN